MMIPARVALALQADGWWIRSEIIWAKAAPMPESVRDRPTCAHEKVWLLTKAATYFYDADAVAEPASGRDPGNIGHKYAEMGGTKGGLANIGPAETRNLRNVIKCASPRVRLRRDLTIEQKTRIMSQIIQRGLI